MFSNSNGQTGIPRLILCLENNPEGFFFLLCNQCLVLSEMCKFRKILFSVSLDF